MDRKVRILLVDDERDYVDSLSAWLTEKGHEVFASYNGQEAIAAVQNNLVDLVFLDLRMPHVDGIHALREIRKKQPHLPVILVTAFPDDPSIAEASALGIHGLFPKGGGFDRLTGLIQVAIRTHKDHSTSTSAS